MITPQCKDCAFARPLKLGSNYFTCHRFPPTVICLQTGGLEMTRPTVEGDDWCGEGVDRSEELYDPTPEEWLAAKKKYEDTLNWADPGVFRLWDQLDLETKRKWLKND